MTPNAARSLWWRAEYLPGADGAAQLHVGGQPVPDGARLVVSLGGGQVAGILAARPGRHAMLSAHYSAPDGSSTGHQVAIPIHGDAYLRLADEVPLQRTGTGGHAAELVAARSAEPDPVATAEDAERLQAELAAELEEAADPGPPAELVLDAERSLPLTQERWERLRRQQATPEQLWDEYLAGQADA